MKWTLITGAAGGLGQSFCRQYASKGCNLLIQGRSSEQLNELKNQLMETYQVQVESLVSDFTKKESFDEFCVQLKKYPVERLISNAGFGSYGTFSDLKLDEMMQMHQVNMDALMCLNHVVLTDHADTIKEICNVASTASFQPGPWMSVYYATKAYVLSFSQALSVELQPKGISVCALCCGPMETGFCKRAHLNHTWMQKLVMISPDDAVKCAVKGLNRGKYWVVPGFFNKLVILMSSCLPSFVRLKLMSLIQSTRK